MISEPRRLAQSFATRRLPSQKSSRPLPFFRLLRPFPQPFSLRDGSRSTVARTPASPVHSPGPRAGLGDDDGDGPRRRPRPAPAASGPGTAPGAAASDAPIRGMNGMVRAGSIAGLVAASIVGHRSLPAGDRRVPAYRREGRRLRRRELPGRRRSFDGDGGPKARRMVLAVARLVHLDARRGDGERNLPSLVLRDGGVCLGVLGVSHRGGNVESELVHRLHHRQRRL